MERRHAQPAGAGRGHEPSVAADSARRRLARAADRLRERRQPAARAIAAAPAGDRAARRARRHRRPHRPSGPDRKHRPGRRSAAPPASRWRSGACACCSSSPSRSRPARRRRQLDGRVLAFSLALTAATGLFFGILPALRARTTRSQRHAEERRQERHRRRPPARAVHAGGRRGRAHRGAAHRRGPPDAQSGQHRHVRSRLRAFAGAGVRRVAALGDLRHRREADGVLERPAGARRRGAGRRACGRGDGHPLQRRRLRRVLLPARQDR